MAAEQYMLANQVVKIAHCITKTPNYNKSWPSWKEKENGQKYLNHDTATQHLKTYAIKLKCYTN